jgi:glycosidase
MRRPPGFALLGLLALGACAPAEGDRAPGPERDCRPTVFHRADGPAGQVALVGDFNLWDPGAHPMLDPDGDGLYVARPELSPGWHQLRVWRDGQTHLDPWNPLTLHDPTGRENSAVWVPDCGRPAFEVRALTTGLAEDGRGRLALELGFWRARAGPGLDPAGLELRLGDGTLVAWELDPGGDGLRAELDGLSPGKHRLEVRGRDRAGAEAEPLGLPFWIEAEPFDWRDALIYQIMVDRFARGDGQPLDEAAGLSFRQGGDLGGVTRLLRAGYFEALGVRALWLSPLYDNPESVHLGRDGHPVQAYHGYWPGSPDRVEQAFGGQVALEELVTEAHARGVRVLMDAVPNHVHLEHPYAREHAGAAWFNHPSGGCLCGLTCSWETEIERCWFDPFLPDLRWENPAVVERLTADLVGWLERFDLDGLRVDAVPMMPRLAVRHLRDRVQRRLSAGGLHVYLLGECYTHLGGQDIIRYYLGPHSLSGQFDFPVMWALREALAGRAGMDRLEAELARSQAAWEGSGAVMAPILGNHDVPRLVSDLAGDPLWDPRGRPPPAPERDEPYELAAAAFAFLLTLPGAPVLYQGDEFGQPGAGDPDNRRAMRFGQALLPRERVLLERVQALGRARGCSPALRRGAYLGLLSSADVLAYGRDAADGRPALVALHRGAAPRRLELRLPDDVTLEPGAVFADVLGAPVESSGRLVRVELGPRSAAVLLADPACRGR